jgi:hypothetical protein
VPRRIAFHALIALGLAGFHPRAAEAAASLERLDTEKIHALYLEGDFDQGVALLESYLIAGKPMRHSDSAFAFKHLGVMYAADENARDKARSALLQFIALNPSSRLSDMGVSERVDSLFLALKKEYRENPDLAAASANHLSAADSAATASASRSSPATLSRSRRSSSHAWMWIAGGAAAVAAGARFLS